MTYPTRRHRAAADAADGPVPRRRRARAIASAIAVALLAGSAGVALSGGEGGTKSSRREPSARTATVTRTDLSSSRTLEGTLGHGAATTVRGGGDGRITWLPATGSEVTRGRTLYRVDDRPVPVLYGDLPLYRRLDAVNTVGRDVRVLADNLRALGYSIGHQPAPGQKVTVRPSASAEAGEDASDDARPAGSKASAEEGRPRTDDSGAAAPPSASPAPQPTQVRVRPGDAVLTTELIDAVERWQIAIGAPPTGVVDAHDVVVLTGPMRVESLRVQVGDPADGELLRATATTKAVTVPVEAGDLGGIERGQRVTVRLPDDTTTEGKVSSVSTVAETEGEDDAARIDVLVTFEEAADAKKFDAGPVQVDFIGETRRDVLAVPVTALLALREGGYGVQLADGGLIAVTTGLFAQGQVEISGKGVTEGARVVVAS